MFETSIMPTISAVVKMVPILELMDHPTFVFRLHPSGKRTAIVRHRQ